MREIREIFYCNHCGETFDEVEEKRNYPVSEFSEYETYHVCPLCQSEDYEESFKCEICGQWHPESEEGDAENVGKSCEDKLCKEFYSILEASFSNEEQEVLKQIYRL